jgi:hypothetical protein
MARRYRRNVSDFDLILGLGAVGIAGYIVYELVQGVQAIPDAVQHLPQDVSSTFTSFPGEIADIFTGQGGPPPVPGAPPTSWLENLGNVLMAPFGGPPVVITDTGQ